VISTLVARARERAEMIRVQEAQTSSLYYLSRDLAAAADIPAIMGAAIANVEEALSAHAVILLAEGERLEVIAASDGLELDGKEQAVADWAFRNRQQAGRGAETLISARLLYLPLQTPGSILGVLGVKCATNLIIVPRKADVCWMRLPLRRPWPLSGSVLRTRRNRPRYYKHGRIWSGLCSTPFPMTCALRWYP